MSSGLRFGDVALHRGQIWEGVGRVGKRVVRLGWVRVFQAGQTLGVSGRREGRPFICVFAGSTETSRLMDGRNLLAHTSASSWTLEAGLACRGR